MSRHRVGHPPLSTGRCAVETLLLVAICLHGTIAHASDRPDNQAVQPFRIADNLFYVGTNDLAVYLITTPKGHVLIDGGYSDSVGMIRRSIESLGYRLHDIKIILNTQAHFDHAGGFAELKRLTGAQLIVSERDTSLVESGGKDDFYFGDKGQFPPAKVDRTIHDGSIIDIGGLRLKALLTPGHTKGCTTWLFNTTDRGKKRSVVDVCGLTILPGTRLKGMPGYPRIRDDYRESFRKLKRIHPEFFLGAHASYFNALQKAESAATGIENPFIDLAGFRAYVDGAQQRFLQRIKDE